MLSTRITVSRLQGSARCSEHPHPQTLSAFFFGAGERGAKITASQLDDAAGHSVDFLSPSTRGIASG